MSLTGSMWTGVSGLLTHGSKMQVIGNNIANAQTIAFKSQRMDFEDLMYQNSFSAAGPSQIGRGVGVSALINNLKQGYDYSSGNNMDLAISGKGYFQVRDQYSDKVWYTRAGNFDFKTDGYLRNPQGYSVQGWKVDNSSNPSIATGAQGTSNIAAQPPQGTGVPTDVRLDTWNLPAKQTTVWKIKAKLSSNVDQDKTPDSANPFFALSQRWDGRVPLPTGTSSPLADSAYADKAQAAIRVYDEAGNAHDLTTYFDQITIGTGTPALKTASAITAGKASAAAGTKPLFSSNGQLPVTGTNAVTYASAIGEINTVLGLPIAGPPQVPALTDLPIRQLPSGAWRFDLDAAEKAAIITAAQRAAILADPNVAKYAAFGTTSQADPQDVTNTVQNLPAGHTMYEYLVTMKPGEDKRTFGGVYDSTTGVLSDGPATPRALTSHTKIPPAQAVAAAGAKLSFGAASSAGNAKTYQQALDAVDAALGNQQGTTTQVGILQLPSGAWILDPADPTVDAALKAPNNPNAAPLPTAPLDPSYTAFGAATVADPLDLVISKVRKFNETKAGGILMRGTIVFDSAGNIVNQTAYTYMGNTPSGDDTPYSQDPNDLNNWQPTAISSNGYPVLTANFSGHPMANGVRQTASNNKPEGKNSLIEIDLGYRVIGSLNAPWTNTNSAAGAGTDYSKLAHVTTGNGKTQADATVNTGGAFLLYNSQQDGYASGRLNDYYVDRDGILYGIYSNEQTLPLYQIALFGFVDQQGLRREGRNLYSATRASGNPQVSQANQNGFGQINANSLEGSNVDHARETVEMMSTQRGFQANSKTITTADMMTEIVINMKR